MTVIVTLAQIRKLAPNVRSSYSTAFDVGQPILDHYGISDNPLRIVHFMAQVLHECGALKIQWESLYYTPKRLPEVWPKRFKPKGKLEPKEYAYNEEKLGDAVYGGRLGNDQPGDGFKYRGRGLLQLTGKEGYRDITIWLHQWLPAAPDFVMDPDAVLSPDWCLHVAAAKWKASGCNKYADRDSVTEVTEAINGGTVGLDERKDWTKKARKIWL